MGLEYALDIPKTFWLNLQANYEAELLELNEEQTITEEERAAREELKEVVKYLRAKNRLPEKESKDQSILSLRKRLQISDISNLKELVPAGVFRMASGKSINLYVLGAWLRLCQLEGENTSIETHFESEKIKDLIFEIKQIMLADSDSLQHDLRKVMSKYGIDFSLVMNFRGAPVQGYIAEKKDGTYQMVLTIRGAYADIFWFSLFHELGHIVNGDIGKTTRFIDDGVDIDKEREADLFARDSLLDKESYAEFINAGDFSIPAITTYAASQNVKPYIVIGRLQREKYIDYRCYNEYKLRYRWAK